MSKRKRVMVIGHEASLSGAPILLLHLFELLIEREIVDVQFVIRRGGPLVKEYRKIAPVIVLKQSTYGKEKTVFLHALHFIQNKIKLLTVLVKAFSCDYLFFNTVVNGKLLRWLYFLGKPVITYVHELGNVIDFYLKQNDAGLPLSLSEILVYPSEVTKSFLLEKYKVPNNKLKKLIYYFPFSKDGFDQTKIVNTRRQLRQSFNVSEGDFLVGAMGTVTERKGIDFFIDVCRKAVLINPFVKFMWIGPFESVTQEVKLKDIVKRNKLEENIIFTGPLEYSIYNFSPFDIFFLSSREDTYPLVVLEAAIMKIPSLCFSDSGGIVEFVSNDAGWLIDNFSTTLAAEKIIELQGNRDVIKSRGSNAFDKVISSHCNENLIVNQYNSIINALK